MQCSLLILNLLVFWFIVEVNSQTAYVPNSENPDRPGLCHFKETNTPDGQQIEFYMKPGQTRKHPKDCLRLQCDPNFSISITGCGLGATQGHCRYIEGDRSKPYPACCGEFIC